MSVVDGGGPASGGRALTCHELVKSYAGVTVLKSVSFSVSAGEVVGLIGENGAVKSTLSSILAGILVPDSGSMTIDGEAYLPHSPHDALEQGGRVDTGRMNRDALVGLVNGLPTTYGRVQPFVVTLATMSAAAGMALYITKGQHYRVAKTKVYVIAVVVIRGASLAGGVGSMGGAFVGLLIIGVLNNGLSLLHVNPNLQAVVIGVVILAAGLADRTGIKNRG